MPGQPLMFTASGEFESAPAVENMEVAAAAGSGACCAFDSTPNADTAIEDKIKDR